MKAFFKEAGYQTLDVISFGALHRQDKLVDKNLAGEISDTEYYSKTSWNVALSAGQAAMTLGTGGTLGATRGAATAWGAASGIVAQGLTDVGEVYATETKNLEDIRARDYLVAGAMGALGGYAGYKARGPQPARAGPSQAEKSGVIAEHGQSVMPDAPVPAAPAASATDVNVQPAIKPAAAAQPSALPAPEASRGALPESLGPRAPRSPLGRDVVETFPDPDPRTYRNGLRPDSPVVDHVEARALGGDPVDPRNLHEKAWSENARKGWNEGEYLKLKKAYMKEGLTKQQAEWVLEDYKRWIETDVHATPVDPRKLDKMRSP